MTVLRGLRLSVAEDYLYWLLYLYYPPATNAVPIPILIWEGLKYEVSSHWRNEMLYKLFIVTTHLCSSHVKNSKWSSKCKPKRKIWTKSPDKVLNFDHLFGFHSVPNGNFCPLKSFWGSNKPGFLSVLEQLQAFCLKASEQPTKAVMKKKLKWQRRDS